MIRSMSWGDITGSGMEDICMEDGGQKAGGQKNTVAGEMKRKVELIELACVNYCFYLFIYF